MTPKAAARLARFLWGFVLVALVLVVTVFVRTPERSDPLVDVVAPLMAIGYATVGALVASRHPTNPIGWLFLASGFSLAWFGLSESYLRLGDPGDPLPGAQWAAWANTLLLAPTVVPIPVSLLLFPNGELPSRRWRWVLWAMGIGVLLALLGTVISPGTIGGATARFPNPTGVEPLEPLGWILPSVGATLAVVAGVACLTGLVIRFRRSHGDERQQLRWIALAAATAAAVPLAMFVFGLLGASNVVLDSMFLVLFLILAIGIPAASAIAILRYRLYDLEIVVKKTVVFALVAAIITGIYIVVVLAIPTVIVGIGSGGGFSPIQFLAVTLVALAINPVRTRARRWADRLVYGKRATPYEVLSELADRVGETYSTEDVLPRMAQLVSAGTGARVAQVWLRVGPELRLEAQWPDEKGTNEEPKPLDGTELPSFGSSQAFPVSHQGELLGALVVTMPPSDPLTPSQAKLLQDLSAQAGLVLRNVALTADLRARLEELQASRQRLVAAQDEERRRLERNIHDGAQQQMVAIGVKLGLARSLAERDPAKADAILVDLQRENQEALENLRDLARGIYPPLLADQGLVAALEAQARKTAFPVRVEADGVGRYPQDVEAAVYFIALEALQNVSKYARATEVTIEVAAANGSLTFEVRDDGVGFDPAAAKRGSGLTNMADRLAALGGELEIRSVPGGGTAVRGRVPATAERAGEVDQPAAAAAVQASANRSGLNADLGM